MTDDIINKKEKILIEYIIADKEVFVQSYHILKPEYFESPLDKVVGFILEYFKKHMDVPDVDIVEAETDILLKERELSRSEHSYLLEEIEEHCKLAEATLAVLECADFINEGKPEMIHERIREAMLVKLDRSMGICLYDNPEERIERISEDVVEYSTGIQIIDEIIGNLRKGEFGMVYAVSSGGKSVMLANIAYALSKQKLNGIIITLELKEELYSRRLDSIITGTSMTRKDDTAEKVTKYYDENCGENGEIVIKKMPAGCTASDIEAYLMEYTLVTEQNPDFVIVDYLQLMGDDKPSDGKFEADHKKALALIRMGEYHDAIMLSAGQINREGQDVLKVNASHCAGGISVINDSDWSIALVASEEDLDNNQIQVAPLKIRHAKKQTGLRTLYRNPDTLAVSEQPMNASSKGLPNKSMNTDNSPVSGKEKLRKALKL